ncbi:MAG TPA: YebC/PmpR family DNA-binding transcriptional regulator [Candidatus Paceibacterota bacterium]|nr:YebC/PmpR family DNA-binding transcriptional regulator [Candidatus Paceibacterota bacterium]HMO82604.1 YebC/PmpR family DNA-binding transcriptional regulator [Candidatus Paceibacterota bacterium]
MSGHNKWSKIKHKKAATDSQKSRIFSRYSRLITLEAKKANGDILSPALAAIIDRAKKDSMPKENIERAVAKGTSSESANLEELLYETYGPGGVAILIVVITDNNNRTAPEIKNLLVKAGYQIATPGSASWAFNKHDDSYYPTSPLALGEDDGEKLTTLVDLIENHPDVQAVYTSADSPSNP